ncbi:alternative ribosome rescue aminoacyl-tRNA hydrolase ArfB [Pseudodesulfovibrio senegalensis]|nr:alternative ribosome rescue aminoacyl-tRNA hydrolase ArfB [Pseudodesulfovibrio senegalensis]
MSEMIQINERVSIPKKELRFSFSRSPGPGGQHVNTTATRVTVFFDVEKTRSLTELQKMVVKGKLRRRMDKKGVLRISVHDFRSQNRNRQLAVDRFVEIMREALQKVSKRKPTIPTKGSLYRDKRVKKRRSQVKRMRRKPSMDD